MNVKDKVSLKGGKLTPDDLGQVLEQVFDMSARWYSLGLQLTVRSGMLDAIKAQFSDPRDQLREMLKIWLDSGASPSWKTLTAALRTRSVGANRLAEDLETKYCLVETTEVGSNTPSEPETSVIPPSVSEPAVPAVTLQSGEADIKGATCPTSQPATVTTPPCQPMTAPIGQGGEDEPYLEFGGFSMSATAIGEQFRQFRISHDLCIYTDNKMFGITMRSQLDQCVVDMHHMSSEGEQILDQVSSVWYQTCIHFFDNLATFKGDQSKIITTICDQSKDLSAGFRAVACWCRYLAGNFYSVVSLGRVQSEEYMECVTKKKREAVEAMYTSEAELHTATTKAEKERKHANRWALVPLVNLVVHPIVASNASEAEKVQNDANRKCIEAKAELGKATTDEEKAKVMAEQFDILAQCVHNIECICEVLASFWQYESDKLSSLGNMVWCTVEFIKLGVIESTCEELLVLRERKTELRKCRQIMTTIKAACNTTILLQPTSFPSIQIPTLNLTLQ